MWYMVYLFLVDPFGAGCFNLACILGAGYNPVRNPERALERRVFLASHRGPGLRVCLPRRELRHDEHAARGPASGGRSAERIGR